ncbi:MAG: hypothetical protein QXJ97_11235 [Desulfurococcaceae archaeon]
MYDENCFITLTYDNDHLPKDLSLTKREFQLFMKRLRKHFEHKMPKDEKIRYAACGEYGEKYGRPHYHAILFNLDFPDKKLHKIVRGHRLYTSETLQEIWQHRGFCVIGSASFESAAYVSRYILKKRKGRFAEKHPQYERVDEDGVVTYVQPEFALWSRNPGLGRHWFEKYKHEVYPSDEVIIKGRRMRPPKYYDRLLEQEDPKLFEEIKNKRKIDMEKYEGDNTPERLAVREKVKLAQIEFLKRDLEV